jgi:hypothetical protein
MPLFPTMYYVYKHREYLKFEGVTMVNMKTVVFWDVTVCNLISAFLKDMLHPSEGDSGFCQNT